MPPAQSLMGGIEGFPAILPLRLLINPNCLVNASVAIAVASTISSGRTIIGLSLSMNHSPTRWSLVVIKSFRARFGADIVQAFPVAVVGHLVTDLVACPKNISWSSALSNTRSQEPLSSLLT